MRCSHSAVEMDGAATVKLLLEHGAAVDAQDKNGITALHLAVWTGKMDIVRVLLEHRANVNAHASDGEAVLYMAEEAGLHGNRQPTTSLWGNRII